jgi:linoleoyl-CoA desaturase
MVSTKIKFVDKNKSQFYTTVKQRVDEYFTLNNISKNANLLMYLKSLFFLSIFVSTYLMVMFGNYTQALVLFSICILHGASAAFIGFNVCHDAIHGSYSSNPWVNKFFSMWFYIIGANSYMWSITHNLVHHTFTNIEGHDEDIEVAPGLLRMSPHDEIKPIQKYQHYYAFLLYSFASISWVFRKDFVKFFQKRIGNYDNSNHPPIEYVKLFLSKAIYYTLFLVLPLIYLPFAWWQVLLGFLVVHLTEGLVLGLVFQLAHVVEGTEFPVSDEQGNIDEAWAVHQMKTTANFCRKSFIATWFCGGLNMQVEHHLFPKICHIHYMQISDIVKATAIEFGVPYHENKTFLGAIKSHYNTLKKYALEVK